MENFIGQIREAIGIEITSKMIRAFLEYEGIFLEWNKKINLTRITEHKEIYIKHFIDSLFCFRFLPTKGSYSVIDVGTGGGFPGIPIKIVNDEIDLTLTDSVKKKAEFCGTAVDGHPHGAGIPGAQPA